MADGGRARVDHREDGSIRALVVAAHPAIRGVMDLACRGAGVAVVERAGTAAEATAACRARPPDILVLDLDLPDDGFRVLTDLGAACPSGVLVLADRADGEVALRVLRLGARGLVRKADGLHELSDSIRRLVAGERVMGSDLEVEAVRALGRLARRSREGAEVEAGLTARERQVLQLLSEGRTTGQTASRLGISPRTVESHIGSLYRKLGVRTRLQATSRAAALGLVELYPQPDARSSRWMKDLDRSDR